MTDPFTVLALDETATKKDIITKVTDALREGRYNAKTVTAAQKTLFSPLARAQAEFRYRIGFHLSPVEPPQAPEASTEDRPQLTRLLL